MIKLEINSLKELSVKKGTKVYKGENMINSIQVTALNPYIGDKRVSECEFFLHVVLPDNSYITYPVTWSENSIPLTGFVPITADITRDAQILRLYIEIKSGAQVIGKSNSIKLQVYDSPNEQTSITPRGQLEETISELETELESATELTDALEELRGNYASVPARIAADENQISANASNISSSQSAIVALTAAVNNKLDDQPSSVSTANIADRAVTGDKIELESIGVDHITDSAVIYQHLDSSVYTNTPAENDTKLITSGGVYNAITKKTVSVYNGQTVALSNNTEYTGAPINTVIFTYPQGDFECALLLTFADSGTITVTFPTSRYIGSVPSFSNGETWEISIKNGIIVAGKVE